MVLGFGARFFKARGWLEKRPMGVLFVPKIIVTRILGVKAFDWLFAMG